MFTLLVYIALFIGGCSVVIIGGLQLFLQKQDIKKLKADSDKFYALFAADKEKEIEKRKPLRGFSDSAPKQNVLGPISVLTAVFPNIPDGKISKIRKIASNRLRNDRSALEGRIFIKSIMNCTVFSNLYSKSVYFYYENVVWFLKTCDGYNTLEKSDISNLDPKDKYYVLIDPIETKKILKGKKKKVPKTSSPAPPKKSSSVRVVRQLVPSPTIPPRSTPPISCKCQCSCEIYDRDG
jgi:ABC-type antimicrobial peptide transport system permease subunit